MPSRSRENVEADPYNQKNYRLYNMHLAPLCTLPCIFILFFCCYHKEEQLMSVSNPMKFNLTFYFSYTNRN